MGIAQKIDPRDAIETVVTPKTNPSQHLSDVASAVASIQSKKYHIIKTENTEMPSHLDGTVLVTHIYYREVLPV